MSLVEKSYSVVFKNVLKLVNPLKKTIIKTECEVHKFINNQALMILKADGYEKEFQYFISYIKELNEGVVWADQDFKSSNHFYNGGKDKGLYGCSDAQRECFNYYSKALIKFYSGNIKKAMFYLGAACHLVQDMTVPQHVNVKLLNHHRRYEKWVIKAFKNYDIFTAKSGGIYLKEITEFIKLNTKTAIETYNNNLHEEDLNARFYKITSVILVLAQRTTAGMLLKFYNDTQSIKPHTQNTKNAFLK